MSTRAKAAVLAVSLLVVAYVGLGAMLGRTASEGAYRQLAVFSEVLAQIQNNYVEDPNMPRVTVGALRGLLEALDPYSTYLSPREFAQYQQQAKNPPAGDVGLILSKRLGMVSVVAVLPDSPGAKAGLRTGEMLESIAGYATRDMSVDQAYQLLAGEPGSVVKLSVVREQRADPQEVELVRAKLRPAKVVSGKLEGDIGYLKVASLEPGRAADIRSALQQLRGQGVQKLILDLRGCASGAPEEGVEIARLFLPSGAITFAQGQRYPKQTFAAVPDKVVWSGPLTVLISPGTAGAAEIVAAAVQENDRGELVGQRTYGVGSVMKVIPLEDGSALILSVAKYHTPSGKAIPDHAVQPTVTVEQPAEQVLAPLPHALPAPGDPVVNKALEVLRGEEARSPRRAA
jgi:carboxyl-terminal processing protease